MWRTERKVAFGESETIDTTPFLMMHSMIHSPFLRFPETLFPT